MGKAFKPLGQIGMGKSRFDIGRTPGLLLARALRGREGSRAPLHQLGVALVHFRTKDRCRRSQTCWKHTFSGTNC
jgi:hypothetical protein